MFTSKWSAAACAAALCAGPAAAQSSLDNLQVHGYLTQAYAQASDLSILGISKDGVADYRAAALQFRYGISERDNFVVQLAHRRVGESILNDAQDDVALDWAFYQRRFDFVSARIGRVPIPRGIYNEIRDVGTMLPFYRAPYNFYTESYETVDGAVLTNSLDFSSWALETNAYAGEFSYRASVATPAGPSLLSVRGQRLAGGQLWLSTPLDGLRVGTAASRFTIADIPGLESLGRIAGSQLLASVDGNFSRVMTRVEAQRLNLGELGTRSEFVYAQVGVKPLSRLGVYVQTDVSQTEEPSAAAGGARVKQRTAKDDAASVTYAFSPNLQAKFEAHRATGYSFDTFVSPAGPRGRTNYFIGSLAVSF